MAVKAKSGAEAKQKKKKKKKKKSSAAKGKTFKSLERFCSVKSNLALTVSSYLAMIKTEMGMGTG